MSSWLGGTSSLCKNRLIKDIDANQIIIIIKKKHLWLSHCTNWNFSREMCLKYLQIFADHFADPPFPVKLKCTHTHITALAAQFTSSSLLSNATIAGKLATGVFSSLRPMENLLR